MLVMMESIQNRIVENGSENIEDKKSGRQALTNIQW